MVSPTRIKELEDINILESFINKNVKEEKESKELFSNANIETRTDLTTSEIIGIAKLKFLCDEYGLDNFRKMLIYFMELKLSKDRKSRKEFIEAIKRSDQFNGFGNSANLGGFNNGRTN